MGFFDDPGNQVQPQDTSGRSTAGTILSMLGGVTGSGVLSGLGGMFNNEARLKFLDAQRPRLLKLARDEGIIDQKKADFLQQMPLEAAMPDLHDINQQLFAQKSSKAQALVPEFNAKTGQEKYFMPTVGGGPDPGFVTSSFYQKPKEEKPYVPSNLGSAAYSSWIATHPGDTAGALAAMQQVTERDFQQRKDIAAATAAAYRQPREGPGEAAAKAAAETAARLQVTDAYTQQKPFGAVSKDLVPFVNYRGRDTPLPTTTPYGRVLKVPGVFYVPKSDVQNGTFARLQALPDLGQKMVDLAPKVLGGGGVRGYLRRKGLEVKGNPAYAAFQTNGAALIESATSALSRRVSQPQIDMWRNAIFGPFATPNSVQSAVKEMTDEADNMRNDYRESSGPLLDSSTTPPPPPGFK